MNRKDKFEKDIELKHNYSKYKKHHKMNSHYNNQDKNKKDLIEKKDDNFIKRIMSSISQKIDSIAGLEEINSINNEKNNEEVKNHPKHIKKEKNIPPKYNKENFNIEKKHEKNIKRINSKFVKTVNTNLKRHNEENKKIFDKKEYDKRKINKKDFKENEDFEKNNINGKYLEEKKERKDKKNNKNNGKYLEEKKERKDKKNNKKIIRRSDFADKNTQNKKNHYTNKKNGFDDDNFKEFQDKKEIDEIQRLISLSKKSLPKKIENKKENKQKTELNSKKPSSFLISTNKENLEKNNGKKKEEVSSNEKSIKKNFQFKNPINHIKKIINSEDEENKAIIGAGIFGLVIIVILFSSYYLLIYTPSQEELSTAKVNKLNELNSLFKGPLSISSEVFNLKSEIERSNSAEEVNAIDLLRPATSSWRNYQNKIIDKEHDDFNRIMAVYESNIYSTNNTNSNFDNKNVIMDIEEAHSFVNQNDGKILSNVEFKKPNTVAVPILITRLQAGAGLISVGSIVDIYSLESTYSQYQNNEEQENENLGENLDNNSENSSESNGEASNISTNSNNQEISKSPNISGATILAIMRAKDSGVIDATYIKSQTKINGDNTNQVEDSSSFSTDVEEMIRGAITGGYNEEKTMELLNNYGLKLSNYERVSNIAEIDVQYLVLIEVPQEDVVFLINNMENIIITIPTQHSPNWMIEELKEAYAL